MDELDVYLPLQRQQQPDARLRIPEPADIHLLLENTGNDERAQRCSLKLKGQQLLSHLKHVGHDVPFALDVDAADAIVLPDRRLAAGRRLQLTGALKGQIYFIEFVVCRVDSFDL